MSEARKSDLIDISCVIKQERDKAIAVSDGTMETLDNGSQREKWHWLPRSQIEIEPDGDTFIVTMPVWLAKEKGLI